MAYKFRFQDLEIWKEAVRLGGELEGLADQLQDRKHFRHAEQLRSAALSMSNNIAEGAGSTSTKEFQQFLNYARRSMFENANMLLYFAAHQHLPEQGIESHLTSLHQLAARTLNFSRSLNREPNPKRADT